MIYNVPFSTDLANTVADELLKRYQNNPFELANVLLILPTKRACLTVKNAFLKYKKGNFLLPQMMPIYNLEGLNKDIPPAISNIERILLLAKLCQAKPNIKTYDQALKMAISLAELLDTAYQFDLNLSKLNGLVDIEQFATHWQQTIEFLDILYTHWPRILVERNQIDPMDRTIRLIRAFTNELKQHPEKTVFMAGFTDAFPAITDLIQTVAANQKNVIFTQIFPTENENIQCLNQTTYPQEQPIIDALTKDSWTPQHYDQNVFQNVRLINAGNTSEEALTIALLLRQVLETQNQTGALVTTDRTLARQVIAQMKRWNILLDDSAGTPLNHTDLGLYLCLIADLGLKPTGINYLSLFKHPLAADGQKPSEFRQKVQEQELFLRHNKQSWELKTQTNFTKWIDLFKNNNLVPFKEIITQHIEIAEQLAKSSDKTATQRLWQNDVGKQMFKFLSDLLLKADIIGNIESQSYPEILKLLMQQQSARPRYGMHPRLDILGPIEARFHHVDVCVIGGLNEGFFPSLPETGPWLNRPMRHKFGLPAPEAKIKELATDFAHCFCSKTVYLTRALKTDGTQAVPSRFIERLKAVCEINNLKFPEYQANLSRLLDTPEKFDTPTRPCPCPPTSVRPNKLPVTQIEMWRRNPYGIYARYILKLYPLSPLEEISNNSEFGQLIHKVIHLFLQDHPNSTDKNLLLHIAQKVFHESPLTEIDKTLLNIKFSAIADFLIQQQIQDDGLIKKSILETEMTHDFNIDGKTFTLTGIADRIDWMKNGTIRIIDYKNYHPPKKTEVAAGYSPQLILEALLLSETQSVPVGTLSYWYLSNKKDASEAQIILSDEKEIGELEQKAKDGLFEMVRTFRSEKTPYEVCPIPSQAPHYNDYAHLARMQEWAVGQEEEE